MNYHSQAKHLKGMLQIKSSNNQNNGEGIHIEHPVVK